MAPPSLNFTLSRVGIRVPLRGELYIDRNGKVQRCKEDRQYSKNARKKIILKEDWTKKDATT